MKTDPASLKMAFDATIDPPLRFHLRKPIRPKFAGGPELLDVYARAYELALRRAATFEGADDPSLVSTPPEFDEMPFAEAWRRGVRAGDYFGRLMRETALQLIAEDSPSIV